MSENGEMQGKTIEETAGDLTALTKQLVSDPDLLEKFGKKLMSFVGKTSGYIETLPKSVRRRVKALRKLQLDVFKVEAQFFEEVHKLEAKYAELYKPLFNKRSEIVNGVVEPTDSECEWESEEEHECSKEGGDCCDKEAAPALEDKPDSVKSTYDENTKGIPQFWYSTLKNNEIIDQLIMPHDEEALETLKDITVTYNKEEEKEMYFEVHFEFNENKFFENKVLTKRYYLKVEPSSSFPLNYDGPEIVKSTGCTINWKEGKNLTSYEETKKIYEKVEEKGFSSFFQFFETRQETTGKDSDGDKDSKEDEMMMDFEIGQLLQSSVIPKAVLHFSGEISGCDEDEEYEEDEDGEGEYDEDEDPEFVPKGKPKANECNQQ